MLRRCVVTAFWPVLVAVFQNVVGSRARRGHAGAAVCSARSGLGGDNCLCCANSYDGDGREMLSYRTRSIAVTVTPPPAQLQPTDAHVRHVDAGAGRALVYAAAWGKRTLTWIGSTCSQAKKAHSHSHGDACATPHPYPSLSLARRSTNAYCAQRCPQHEFPTRLAVPKSCPKSGHTAA